MCSCVCVCKYIHLPTSCYVGESTLKASRLLAAIHVYIQILSPNLLLFMVSLINTFEKYVAGKEEGDYK